MSTARQQANLIDHREAARWHAVKRGKERYGLYLGIDGIFCHELEIRNGEAEIIGYSASGKPRRLWRKLYRLPRDQRDFYAVFDPELDCIVTYLRGPHEWLGTFVRKP